MNLLVSFLVGGLGAVVVIIIADWFISVRPNMVE